MFQNLAHEMMIKMGVREPEKYHDKVFFMGEPMMVHPIDKSPNHAFNIGGLVRLNERITGDPIIERLPTVGELRSGGLYPYQLASMQALILLKIKDRFYLPLLQRDMDAPTDPGMWTLPAGRMDHRSFTLGALMEALEEMRLIGENVHYLPTLAVLDEAETRQVFQESWNLVRTKHATERAKVNEVKLVTAQLYDHSQALRSWHIRHDGILERRDRIMACWDGANNTLEAVVPMTLELPELVSVYDGESFGRSGALLPLEDLLSGKWLGSNKTTFALRKVFTDYRDFFKEIL